jgi:lysozyme
VTVAAANYDFVVVKATEGLKYDSPEYPAQIDEVRAAHKRAGAYHFAWPNQDPVAEAAHFVKTAALKPGEIACLDLESWDATTMTTTPWTVRLAYALKWLAEVKTATGATPFVYLNWDWLKNLRSTAIIGSPYWVELTSYPLWLADYSSKMPGQFPSVDGGWQVVLHQWTDNDGGLDGDWLADTALWDKYAVPAGGAS